MVLVVLVTITFVVALVKVVRRIRDEPDHESTTAIRVFHVGVNTHHATPVVPALPPQAHERQSERHPPTQLTSAVLKPSLLSDEQLGDGATGISAPVHSLTPLDVQRIWLAHKDRDGIVDEEGTSPTGKAR